MEEDLRQLGVEGG